MIKHNIYFEGNGFHYQYVINLPYRLNKADLIYIELLDNLAKLQFPDKETDEWIEFCVDNQYFEIERIQIDFYGDIEVFLMVCND
jgi:hypothetical protein